MKPTIIASLVTCLFLSATSASAQTDSAEGQIISEIDVVDNSKTTDDTVMLIADVDVGDRFSFELKERINKNLISSGLFSSVKVFTGPSRKGVGVRLTIIANEKHSWVIGPTFYNEPGNLGGGLGFLEANLFGENKKFLAYAQYATTDSLFITAYWDPSIANSAFSWRIYLFGRKEDVTEYTDRLAPPGADEPVPDRISQFNQLSAGLLIGVNLWRGLTLDMELTPSLVSFDDVRTADDMPAPQTPQDDGTDVSATFRLIRDKRANWHGVTSGSKFALAYERALPALGSDFEYWIARANLLLAKKIFAEHNFVIKTGFQIGKDLPFHREFTSGGNDLRGYIKREFRGNMKATGTIEYSVPLFKIQPLAFRGMVFWDTAYTTFRDSGSFVTDNPNRHYLPEQLSGGSSLSKWKNGIGAGFRVYIKSVVLPLLGVDVGYGVEAKDYHVYFALGLLEF